MLVTIDSNFMFWASAVLYSLNQCPWLNRSKIFYNLCQSCLSINITLITVKIIKPVWFLIELIKHVLTHFWFYQKSVNWTLSEKIGATSFKFIRGFNINFIFFSASSVEIIRISLGSNTDALHTITDPRGDRCRIFSTKFTSK